MSPSVAGPVDASVLGWGVLGTASIAERKVIPALLAHPAARLAAIGSRALAKAEQWAARFAADRHGGYEDVLADPAVDAVYLPLPNALHGPWARRALLAGKHVLVEKPLATDPTEASALFRLARERGLTLMECMTFPRHSQHTEVARLCARIGGVREVSATFVIPQLPPDDIRYSAELHGGALADLGVYPIRAALYFLGPRLRVVDAVLHTDPAHLGVDVGGRVRLAAPDGRAAVLEFGIGGAYRCEYRVVGAGGAIDVQRAFTLPATEAPNVTCATPDPQLVELPCDDHFGNTITAFTAALGSACPDTEATMRQLELVTAIRRSAVRAPRPGTREAS